MDNNLRRLFRPASSCILPSGRQKKKTGQSILSVLILIGAGSTPALSETLYEAMAAAYDSNPRLEADRLRQRGEQENIRQALAGIFPRASLDLQGGNTRNQSEPPVFTTHADPEGVGLSLSQPLFTGFRTFNGTKRAKAEVVAGQHQLDGTEQDVLLETVTTYADVIRDRKVRDLQRQNVGFLSNEVKASKARQTAGDLSKTDVAQARTRFHEGKADEAQAIANVLTSEARYVSVVGQKPGRLVKPRIPSNLIPKTFAEALDLAEQQNPNIGSARALQEAARRAKLEAYGELLPNVALEVRYDRNYDTSPLTDKSEDSSIFMRMSMPLYQGGTVRSKIRQTSAQESSRRYQLSDTRRRTRASVTDAWQQMLAARARIRAARLQVSSAEEALKGVKIETDVGERSFFEILDAHRELVNSKIAMANAERDVVVANYTLLTTVGRLKAHLLQLAVQHESGKYGEPVTRLKTAGKSKNSKIAKTGTPKAVRAASKKKSTKSAAATKKSMSKAKAATSAKTKRTAKTAPAEPKKQSVSLPEKNPRSANRAAAKTLPWKTTTKPSKKAPSRTTSASENTTQAPADKNLGWSTTVKKSPAAIKKSAIERRDAIKKKFLELAADYRKQ